MPHWVFVWTVGDVVWGILLGACALFFAGIFALLGIDKLWVKLTGRHLPYNRPRY